MYGKSLLIRHRNGISNEKWKQELKLRFDPLKKYLHKIEYYYKQMLCQVHTFKFFHTFDRQNST